MDNIIIIDEKNSRMMNGPSILVPYEYEIRGIVMMYIRVNKTTCLLLRLTPTLSISRYRFRWVI